MAATPDLAQAERLLRAHQWDAAADILRLAPPGDRAARLRLHLARNFAALQRHRPEVYTAVINAPRPGHHQIAEAHAGQLTVIHRPTGKLLNAGPDPAAATASYLNKLTPILEEGHAVGLCGVGDGHLFAALCRVPCETDLGRQTAVFLFEPDAEALVTAMTLHDLSGADGPLQQERVRVYVGPTWREQYRRDVRSDDYLPPPKQSITFSPDATAIHEAIQAELSALADEDRRLARAAEGHYATVNAAALAAALHADPAQRPRRPRAFVATSRFTTVLQHASRRVAAALEALGFDVRLSIEPSPWRRTSLLALRRPLVDFQPDVVFAIDHLRQEYGPLFPPQLPFLTWVQDDLPHLARPEAGHQIIARDFVLTIAPTVYHQRYTYPLRQLIAMTKLTEAPPLSVHASQTTSPEAPHVHAGLRATAPAPSTGASTPDLIYVSHAAAAPRDLLREVVDAFADWPHLQPLVEHAGFALIDRYARGQHVATLGQMNDLLRLSELATGKHLPDPAGRDSVLQKLLHPLNNALYRHQALHWAVDAAAALHLSLGLYGRGWDQHDTFAPFARGPVAYGDALRRLTAAAPVCLHIVPYHHLHQRLLDGIAAGGFFLIREHPADRWRSAFINLLRNQLPPHVASDADARRHLPEPLRDRFDTLVQQSLHSNMLAAADHVAIVRGHEAQGLGFIDDELPRRADVSFTDALSLSRLLEHYTHDADARRAVSAEQQRFLADRFTYEAGMRRALSRVATLLTEEAAAPPQHPQTTAAQQRRITEATPHDQHQAA